MTSLPASIADLIPTQRDLHLEAFDFVANVEPTLNLRSESVAENGEGSREGDGVGEEEEGGGRGGGEGEEEKSELATPSSNATGESTLTS